MALLADITVIAQAAFPTGGSEDEILEAVEAALEAEVAAGDWTINVVLVDDMALQELHRQFMGIDEPTDVMTFPFGDHEQGGEIVISVDRAAEQGPVYGHTAWEEVRYLVLHGVLHLCGWDDGSPEDRERMLARQNQILRGRSR